LEEQVTALTARSEGGDSNAEQAAGELVATQYKLSKTRTAIEELKKFFVQVKKQWTKPKDRVIGHIVWAPPVSVYLSSRLYEGYLRHRARREEVLAELQGERARLRCVLIRLAKRRLI